MNDFYVDVFIVPLTYLSGQVWWRHKWKKSGSRATEYQNKKTMYWVILGFRKDWQHRYSNQERFISYLWSLPQAELSKARVTYFSQKSPIVRLSPSICRNGYSYNDKTLSCLGKGTSSQGGASQSRDKSLKLYSVEKYSETRLHNGPVFHWCLEWHRWPSAPCTALSCLQLS